MVVKHNILRHSNGPVFLLNSIRRVSRIGVRTSVKNITVERLHFTIAFVLYIDRNSS